MICYTTSEDRESELIKMLEMKKIKLNMDGWGNVPILIIDDVLYVSFKYLTKTALFNLDDLKWIAKLSDWVELNYFDKEHKAISNAIRRVYNEYQK
ncbi:hypothetical protein [Pseudostreptobacillus hongkongensis]|uniref:hypothetical protein n=1 Tax=Pseudostreptobacillus hongkongensis TaxID=1162717 RepID=UPI000836B02A|nr:hypothetical protein [Pseudostreptobacillus hongkongensis]